MTDITINPGAHFKDQIHASYLFIDAITTGTTVKAEVFYEGDRKEIQDIVAGSKFVEGANGEKIEKVIFYNKSGIATNVTYRYSTVFGYDERRLVGDVNALTRFDNLTQDGNRFWGGYALPTPAAGLYSQAGFYNPVGSGVTTYIDVLRLNSKGQPLGFLIIDAADFATFLSSTPCKNKQLTKAAGTNAKTVLCFDFAKVAPIGLSVASVSTDQYGTPASLDEKNAPIELTEGMGINFCPTSPQIAATIFAEFWEE